MKKSAAKPHQKYVIYLTKPCYAVAAKGSQAAARRRRPAHLLDEKSEGEKEMKKALALVLAFALLMGLAACTGAANEGAVETPDAAGTPAPVESAEPAGKRP